MGMTRTRCKGTGVLAQMYDCPTHGRIWHVYLAESVDFDSDKIYNWYACSICNLEVKEAKENGIPVMHELNSDELYAEQMFSENDDDE